MFRAPSPTLRKGRTMPSTPSPVIDMRDPVFRSDPHPVLHAVRSRSRVCTGGSLNSIQRSQVRSSVESAT